MKREGLWVRVELPGGGGGQALLVAVGVHGEAAVAAAPVVAVRGKTVREMRNCQSAGFIITHVVDKHMVKWWKGTSTLLEYLLFLILYTFILEVNIVLFTVEAASNFADSD